MFIKLGIPPNSGSDDPKLSAGDDLMLPSDSEFKEQAIDHVMETIIYPDIVKNFENYGLRFYEQASQLSSPEKPEHASVAFSNSIEEYYKFLASYEGKGAIICIKRQSEGKKTSFTPTLQKPEGIRVNASEGES